jgi:hypothetical protein
MRTSASQASRDKLKVKERGVPRRFIGGAMRPTIEGTIECVSQIAISDRIIESYNYLFH